ncbi:hypothetical protein VTO42DRAFT_6272 [Malbranchea cinnamomea]
MQFTPFVSDIELPFYASLASLKLNHDKLDDSTRKVLGLYEIRASDPPEASCRMQIHGNALLNDEAPAGYFRAEGMIKNVNTIEEYRNADKNALLRQIGKTIWDAINDGTIYSCPSLLASFIILSFADLKRYRFSYWFAFPAIHSVPPWTPVPVKPAGKDLNEANSDWQYLTSDESCALVDAVQTWRYATDSRQHGFFLAKRNWLSNPEMNKTASPTSSSLENPNSASPSNNLNFSWSISSLSGFDAGFFRETLEQDRFVCFADPSNYVDSPGWMLRNLLILVRQRWRLNKVQILRYRDVQSRRDEGRSMFATLQSEEPSSQDMHTHGMANTDLPKITGWERNSSGRLSGRVVDLTAYMDPHRLADHSVDLNLKLMKWRISPTLDLDTIKGTRCLLLGAGTLGSYVARNLLGWGVRKITFVDNGRVSFSNPVRQPLFTFTDCLDGGSPKAHRAAAALSEIYPGIESTGHFMSVPMAGHPVTDPQKSREEFELLRKLVESHDAIFLLMDTRESRWLPTVMGKAANKIVMNAAIGFDTFVVMRHGVESPESKADLGCYFCSDVVAPANSTRDQTLDQQCTVTRPGVAAIASALLVELFVSILQHPKAAAAPASPNNQNYEHPLGLVPHQIRGFLSNFSNVVTWGKSYECCSACSNNIIEAYRKDGWEFVQRALNEKDYVEELSGLREVQRKAEQAAECIDFDDEALNDEIGEMV